jgi:hypothetical protein
MTEQENDPETSAEVKTDFATALVAPRAGSNGHPARPYLFGRLYGIIGEHSHAPGLHCTQFGWSTSPVTIQDL